MPNTNTMEMIDKIGELVQQTVMEVEEKWRTEATYQGYVKGEVPPGVTFIDQAANEVGQALLRYTAELLTYDEQHPGDICGEEYRAGNKLYARFLECLQPPK